MTRAVAVFSAVMPSLPKVFSDLFLERLLLSPCHTAHLLDADVDTLIPVAFRLRVLHLSPVLYLLDYICPAVDVSGLTRNAKVDLWPPNTEFGFPSLQ